MVLVYCFNLENNNTVEFSTLKTFNVRVFRTNLVFLKAIFLTFRLISHFIIQTNELAFRKKFHSSFLSMFRLTL